MYRVRTGTGSWSVLRVRVWNRVLCPSLFVMVFRRLDPNLKSKFQSPATKSPKQNNGRVGHNEFKLQRL
ncbi:hypothetical protein HanRHA438_Chr16g0738771 [Helianthus annuus]|nr:hypothetical protein HanRHA438_Chr16g0738771 [Helianthus annuus]